MPGVLKPPKISPGLYVGWPMGNQAKVRYPGHDFSTPAAEQWVYPEAWTRRLDHLTQQFDFLQQYIKLRRSQLLTLDNPSGAIDAGPIMAEAGQVVSMIGMASMSAAPVVGVPLMIGGQIMSWLCSTYMREPAASYPSLADISTKMAAAVEDQAVRNLLDPANAVWDDLLTHMARVQGHESDATDLELLEYQKIIARGIDMAGAETVHVKTSVLKDTYVAKKDGAGHPVGMRHLPAFLWSGTIELLCHEHNAQILQQQTDFGTKDCVDPKDGSIIADKDSYRLALEDWHDRAKEFTKFIEPRIFAALQAMEDRIAAIEVYPRRVAGVHEYQATDKGGWPAKPSDVNLTIDHNMSGVTQLDSAQAHLAQHIVDVFDKSILAFGLIDHPTKTHMSSPTLVLVRWKKALESSTALLGALPKT